MRADAGTGRRSSSRRPILRRPIAGRRLTGARKQPLTGSHEDHRPRVAEQAAVLRARALDSDLLTDLHRVGRPTRTQKRVGVAQLESPGLDLPRLSVLYIDVEVAM